MIDYTNAATLLGDRQRFSVGEFAPSTVPKGIVVGWIRKLRSIKAPSVTLRRPVFLPSMTPAHSRSAER